MKIINVEQNSPNWISWRLQGFGASDSAAILGKSKFSTAYQVWLVRKGFVPAFTGNAATQAGSEAEAKARATYEILHGDFELFDPICVQHDQYDFMLASLDGYSPALKRILEIKYPSKESHELALAGFVPEHYWIQIQHQLACCDEAESAHYWSFREANGALVEVKRDQKFIDEILIPGIMAFKELIDTNTPPPLTEKDAKWMDDEDTLSWFKELLTMQHKANKDALAGAIIIKAGHPKVLTRLGRVTSVQRNGKHSYYKITANGE